MTESTRISALIRGLSFDGEKGAIVAFSAGVQAQAGPETLVFDASQLERPGVEGALVEAWGAYAAEHGKAPRAVAIEGLGRFGIGADPDQAAWVAGGGEGLPTAPAAPREPEEGPDPRIAGRVVVVTGGAQGFGEEIVRAMVARGAFVAVVDLNLQGAETLVQDLNRRAGRTVATAAGVNVADEDSVAAMIETVAARWGGMDLFVSNAGVLKAGSVKELSKQDFDFVTSVNYTGFFLCTKHVAPIMALQNYPSGAYFCDIVQINSKSGLSGSNKNGAYAGAKFGGIGLVQSFAMELVEDNIKVNAVCPGNFFEGPLWSDPDRGLFVQYLRAGKVPGAETIEDVKRFYEEKVPMGRGCRGLDVVRAILYLVEQRYETGQALPVTGGQIMLN